MKARLLGLDYHNRKLSHNPLHDHKIADACCFPLCLPIFDNLLPWARTVALLLSKQRFLPKRKNLAIWKGIHLQNN